MKTLHCKFKDLEVQFEYWKKNVLMSLRESLIINSFIINSCDMVKHELRVKSCELRVASSNSRVANANPRFMSSNSRVQE